MMEEKEWKLEGNSELRIEVDPGHSMTLKLEHGQAECFGAELAPNHEYELHGPSKQAIYTFEGGVTLKTKVVSSTAGIGGGVVEYVSSETVQQKYVKLYDQLFKVAYKRVLIVGEGRNVLARTWTNYGIRLGGEPLLVNLDVRNGAVLFPGVIGALPSTPNRVYEMGDFRGCMLDGSAVAPCAYFFGHGEVRDNGKLYRKLTTALSSVVKARLDVHPQPMIAIGPADADEDLISDLCDLFGFDSVVTVGNERLYNLLLKKQLKKTELLKAPKNVGYVMRDGPWRRCEQQRQFQGYFYGSHSEYTPFSSTLPYASLHVFRVGEGGTVAPSSALPLGATRKVDGTRMARVGELSSTLLLYSVLAVSSAQEEARVGEAPAAGFVYVTGVDEAKGTITLLSPCPGELYSKYLLLGSLKWIEK